MSNDETQRWATVARLAASPLDQPVVRQIRAALASATPSSFPSSTTRRLSAVHGSASRTRYRLGTNPEGAA